jgi:hypothetical protein
LYLIQSPLQAINAFEARHAIADGAERHEVLVFQQKEALNNRILANTLRKLGWEPWRTIPFRAGNVGKMWEWVHLRAALRGLSEVRRCYVGDFAAGMAVAAANLFPTAEHFLLDDGTSTMNFPGFRYEGKRPEHLPASKNVPLLGYNTKLPCPLSFFSIYDVPVQPPDETVRNKLSFLRSAIRFDAGGPVFFIGSCLPDVDVINFDQFFTLFRAARQWLGNRDILYFPHRRELLDRKQSLFRELGVRLAQPDLPFELELIHGSVKPSLIATFYSTALDTLRLVLAESTGHLVSFHVPEGWVQTEAHKEIARVSYEDYRRSAEIEVVDDYNIGSE